MALSEFKNIDEYIATFPKDVQVVLEKIRQTIHDVAPMAEEAIKYQIPTFRVHFAAFAHHVGFYPTPGGIEAFREELSGYEQAKGSVQFPFDHRIPGKRDYRKVTYSS